MSQDAGQNANNSWVNLVTRLLTREKKRSEDIPEEVPLRRKHNRARRDERVRSTTSSRWNDVKSYITRNTAEFFGVVEDGKDEEEELWEMRRMRMLSRQYGVKKNLIRKHSLSQSLPPSQRISLATTFRDAVSHQVDFGNRVFDQMSQQIDVPKRLGALAITYNGLTKATTTLKRRISREKEDSTKSSPSRTHPLVNRTSSVPASVQSYDTHFTSDSVFTDYAREEPGPSIASQTIYEEPEPSPPLSVSGVVVTHGAPEEDNIVEDGIESIESETPLSLPHPTSWYRQRSVEHYRSVAPALEEIQEEPPRAPLASQETIDQQHCSQGLINWVLNKNFRDNLSNDEQDIVDHLDDNRPFFTYWISTVQMLILIITLVTYGFGKPGIGKQEKSEQVLVTSLSLQHVSYFEYLNFWLGPKPQDLIHLGAKFTPCMRNDKLVYEKIADERRQESETACCIRNDGSGCVQTKKESCSSLLSSWFKWDNASNNGALISSPYHVHSWTLSQARRTSGSVCGQDPRYCEQPASIEPYEWPDDITKWPICRKPIKDVPKANYLRHMNCKMIGRPCCMGVHGQCAITTRQYCDFVDGYFHEEATLCSQVSCMEDVCGMLPFFNKDIPDQFYRIWTPIFIHAGILHIFCTLLFQWFIMRDIERMTGWFRIAIIYMGSGIAGYLASAIFVPYRAEVGPAGSIFGLLACLIVEVINNWSFLENPIIALMRLVLIALGLFFLGWLPWVDNYAHLFGFCTGLLLSFALLPYLKFHPKEQMKRIIQICLCLFVVFILIIVLVLLLYVFPVYNCPWCKYFNCIPFRDNWCQDHEIKIPRMEIV